MCVLGRKELTPCGGSQSRHYPVSAGVSAIGRRHRTHKEEAPGRPAEGEGG